MSKYLDRLHALEREKRPAYPPSKGSKAHFEGSQDATTPRPAPFEGFEGSYSRRVSPQSPCERSAVFPVPGPRVIGPTDHFCQCGRLATLAYPNSAGRDVWHCLECLDAYGRA